MFSPSPHLIPGDGSRQRRPPPGCPEGAAVFQAGLTAPTGKNRWGFWLCCRCCQMYCNNIGTITCTVKSASAPPIANLKPKNSCRNPSPNNSPTSIIPMPRTLTMGFRISKICRMTSFMAAAIVFPMPAPSRAQAGYIVVVSTSSSRPNKIVAYLFIPYSLIPSPPPGSSGSMPPPTASTSGAQPGAFSRHLEGA